MTFRYHGSALAIGGRLELPNPVSIPAQGMAVLSPSGGEASSTVRNYDYQGIITFDEATAYVAGSRDGDTYNTLAMVTIRNLSVLGMLQIDHLVSRITSTHYVRNGIIGEGEITLTGSTMRGSQIAGVPLNIAFNTATFSNFPTFDAYTKQFGSSLLADNGGGDMSDGVIASIVDSIDPPFRPLDEKDPYTRMEPDRETEERKGRELYEKADVAAHRNRLFVPHFGKIAVGEVQVEKGYRRLNMLRLDLGCPLVGSVTFGSVEGNGADMPP
jgi:hypothetical protein